MRKTALFAALLLSGCGVKVEHRDAPLPAPQVGGAGILVSTDPDDDSVMAYNPDWHRGMAIIPVGTKATYVGAAPPYALMPGEAMIRVSLDSGDHQGEPGVIRKCHWRALPR